jgi:hypothetical protein
MSGSKINNYSQLDSNILEMQLTLDQTRKGLHQVSLTNYDNTSLPAIAAGSVIEVDDALYKFDSEEVIGGSPSDGTVYVKIIPSTTTCTAEFTNTAPTWSDSKQGWYGTTTSATHRYLEFVMAKATALYSNKRVFTHDDNIVLDILTATTINLTTSISPMQQFNNKIIATGTTSGAVWNTLSAIIPTTGNIIKINGAAYTSSVLRSLSYAERESTTLIRLWGVTTAGTVADIMIQSGGIISLNIAISW